MAQEKKKYPFTHHFDYTKRFSNEELSHFSANGYKKADRRAAFRAGVARKISLGDRFLRMFSFFLVCLVLFAVVVGAEYSSYQNAVQGVYYFTNTVSKAATFALNFIFDTIEFTADLFDGDDIETSLPGDVKIVSIKLNGEWVNFSCVQVHVDSWTSFNSRSAWKIVDAPIEYMEWIGKRVEWFFFWWKLPNGKLITYGKMNISDYVTD